MTEQIYLFTALTAITCNNCKNVEAGDQVDVVLRQDLLPALPFSVRGIVQLVDGLTYTIQYDADDLLGVIASITNEFVKTTTCVQPLTLANEYTDSLVQPLAAALTSLGAVPSDSSNVLQVVHQGSTAGVSMESVKHDKQPVPVNGNESVILDPVDLASPLAINDLTGLGFRIEIHVTALSGKSIHGRDSQVSFSVAGEFSNGSTLAISLIHEVDGVSISGALVGNNIHVVIDNPSSASVTAFITTKLRILS